MYGERCAHSSIRAGVGRASTGAQIDEVARRIAAAAKQLRAFAL